MLFPILARILVLWKRLPSGWLSATQDARLKPNIITYSAVIEASAKSGDMKKAAEWLYKKREAGL